MTRVAIFKEKLMYVKHRHIVFSIPKILCNYFFEDKTFLNLFDSVNETFTWMFNPKSYQNKEKQKLNNKNNKKITKLIRHIPDKNHKYENHYKKMHQLEKNKELKNRNT